jgi:hypothetical protein
LAGLVVLDYGGDESLIIEFDVIRDLHEHDSSSEVETGGTAKKEENGSSGMGPSTPSMEGVAQAVGCAGKASRGTMQVVKHSVKSSFIFTHDRSER